MRAKVALVRGAQLLGASADHGHQSAHARELIAVAESFAWQARRPLTIVVCGVPASGKSHLARALAGLSGLPHLSSGVIRKQLPASARPTGHRARLTTRRRDRGCQRRGRERDRVSDAGVETVVREQTSWEPLDEVPASAQLTLRTDRPA